MARTSGKQYRSAVEQLERPPYTLDAAVPLVQKIKFAKFDETVEVHMRLGVDPKHADQMVRGTVVLPNGLGRSKKVLVIASGDKLREAEEAGADMVGGDDMVQKIQGGWVDFDAVIASHLDRVKPGDYIAITQYFDETPQHEELVQKIRLALREETKCATTTGYGPRFLHSTGQLHKGGPATGVFLQLTAADNPDVPLPGEAFTFGILKEAQALGDFESLAKRDRRAIRIELGNDLTAGLEVLLESVRSRVKANA